MGSRTGQAGEDVPDRCVSQDDAVFPHGKHITGIALPDSVERVSLGEGGPVPVIFGTDVGPGRVAADPKEHQPHNTCQG
ncbi:MAG: hypothetical protein CSA22_05830 [Deltaproteobacteria bacterium]|nr:MAG: hypothetical protein CSA22_05830 [Deltaproteobacteria bacterium]